MKQLPHKNRTWVFPFCLVLAGILHTFDFSLYPTLEAVIFCMLFTVYAALILFWINSVRVRLLPSRAKRYMLAASAFMLLFLLLRTIKYRIASDAILSRYCWYAYYVPLLFISVLFLMCSIAIYKTDTAHRPSEALLLIPAGLLAGAVFTNDFHHLAFCPNAAWTAFDGVSGTYSHEILYFLVCIFTGFVLVSGILFLMKSSRRIANWKKAASPFLFVALIPLLLLSRFYFEKNQIHPPYEVPEILIFSMLGIFEACIRNRLIPHNENYTCISAKV